MTNSVKDLIKKGRTYRSFRPEKVDRACLEELVDGARLVGCATNRQVLKYRLVTDDAETAGMLEQVRFGGMLNGLHLPPERRYPRAYLVICHDTSVAPEAPFHLMDVGMAAEAIVLEATQRGLGCCLLGSFRPEALHRFLGLPDHLVPKLAIAVGVPDESVRLTELPADGSTAYYRDEAGVHVVPKRPLKDVLL